MPNRSTLQINIVLRVNGDASIVWEGWTQAHFSTFANNHLNARFFGRATAFTFHTQGTVVELHELTVDALGETVRDEVVTFLPIIMLFDREYEHD